MCLVDSPSTNMILREMKYFQTLKKSNESVMTIAGRHTVIVGSGQATITLHMGTNLVIQDALLYPDSTRTLLSFKDIRKNDFHVETNKESGTECLLITQQKGFRNEVLENLPSLSTGLY